LRRDAVRNRAALLASGEELLATRGVSVTLDDIAQHAGLNVATAYRHFRSKQELTEALVQQRVDGVVELLEELATRPDPMSALREFLFTAGERQQADRGLREALAANHGMPGMAAHRARLIPLAARLVDRARESGQLRADIEATDIPIVLWLAASLATYSADVHPSLWQRYLQLLVDGMTATQPGAPLPTQALTPRQLDMITRAR
jgi:AcrR family transcriptional regulator